MYLQGDYVQPKFLKILQKPVPVCSFLYLQIYAIFFFFCYCAGICSDREHRGEEGDYCKSLSCLCLFFRSNCFSFSVSYLSHQQLSGLSRLAASFLNHPSPSTFLFRAPFQKRCTLDDKYLIFIPHLPSQASMLVVSFAPL